MLVFILLRYAGSFGNLRGKVVVGWIIFRIVFLFFKLFVCSFIYKK